MNARRLTGVAVGGTATIVAIMLMPPQLAQTIGVLGAMTLIVILAMFPDHI